MKISNFLFGIICLSVAAFAAETPVAQPPAKHFKIIETEHPIYPTRMILEGVPNGMVRAVLLVNSEGKLVDKLIVSYTRKPFANEAERVIETWKYEPEYVNGEAIDTVVSITINFEVNGVMLVQRYGGDIPPMNDIFRELEYQVCTLKNLDRIPTPMNIVSPTYPKEWAEQGITGKVVVDFYIDETGKVRLPAALSGSHELLGGIAVAAVGKWQFSPPTRKGTPVLVHAQQIFDFCKVAEAAK